MKEQSQNEIYEKIRSILRLKVFDIQKIKLKTFNMRTFLWMSSIYTLVWIIIHCDPYMWREHFVYDLYYHLKELLITTFEYMFWVYLPEILIFIFDFFANKFQINDKDIIKTIRILLLILSYVYLFLFGVLILVILITRPNIFGE